MAEPLTLMTLPSAVIEEMQRAETEDMSGLQKKLLVIRRMHERWMESNVTSEIMDGFEALIGTLCDAFVDLDRHRIRVQKKASKLKALLCGN